MKFKTTPLYAALTASALLLSTQAVAASGTLEKVKKNGYLQCGVSTGLPGFSNPNSKGEWEGIDVEFCQAVAAAVLSNALSNPTNSHKSLSALYRANI